MSDGFVKGHELHLTFYRQVVEPLLAGVPHAAARMGTGSDVLGYDTAQSTDHGWGPAVQLFVSAERVEPVRRILDAGLPAEFRGWPVTFDGDRHPIRHHVLVATLEGWLRGHLDVDPRDGMSMLDWLTVPQQAILEVLSGPMLADPDGELARLRELLAYFPPEVHRYLLACQWQRVGQEESFAGRAAQVGDELGSRLAAARVVRDLMRIGFLLERVYWPYPKWFGSAFARLAIAAELAEPLHRAVAADRYPQREAALVEAYEVVARAHNASGLSAPLDPTVRPFFDRPFLVIGASRFVAACRATIVDPELRDLPLVGSVDQFADSADVQGAIGVTRRLRAVYRRDQDREASAAAPATSATTSPST